MASKYNRITARGISVDVCEDVAVVVGVLVKVVVVVAVVVVVVAVVLVRVDVVCVLVEVVSVVPVYVVVVVRVRVVVVVLVDSIVWMIKLLLVVPPPHAQHAILACIMLPASIALPNWPHLVGSSSNQAQSDGAFSAVDDVDVVELLVVVLVKAAVVSLPRIGMHESPLYPSLHLQVCRGMLHSPFMPSGPLHGSRCQS